VPRSGGETPAGKTKLLFSPGIAVIIAGMFSVSKCTSPAEAELATAPLGHAPRDHSFACAPENSIRYRLGGGAPSGPGKGRRYGHE
jgi:hypothetical protein